MTESTNSLQKLFQAGLTREQFIDRYTQLQQKGAKDSSIFNEEWLPLLVILLMH